MPVLDPPSRAEVLAGRGLGGLQRSVSMWGASQNNAVLQHGAPVQQVLSFDPGGCPTAALTIHPPPWGPARPRPGHGRPGGGRQRDTAATQGPPPGRPPRQARDAAAAAVARRGAEPGRGGG